MKTIYFDHAATTYVDPRVAKEMMPYFSEIYGNPSSLYHKGREANKALEAARAKVAKILDCQNEEIIFTGSGTESDNMAIIGTAHANKDQGNHIITTAIEHPAVLETCKRLEKEGFRVTYLPVNEDGLVTPEEVVKAVTKNTILVTIMYANNEIGTIEPIAEIGKALKKKRSKVLFHTDACQAAGACELSVKKMNVDLLTLNGSKIYGPKGVGVLYKKKKVKIEPIIYGGHQEQSLRAGTENVPYIVGFAKALELVQKEKAKEVKRLIGLRDYLIKGIEKSIPKVRLNGHPTKRLPNNVNMSILDIEGEAMLLYLDQEGICASTGSACTSGTLEPSHVIRAIGMPYEVAHGSLRLTLGKKTIKADIDHFLKVFPGIVKKLRAISPVNVDMKIFDKIKKKKSK